MLRGFTHRKLACLSGSFVPLFTHVFQATAGSRIGIESAFKATLSHGGPLALYRGVFPGMLGAFPSHAAYFAVYEHVKRLIGINQEEETLLQYGMPANDSADL